MWEKGDPHWVRNLSLLHTQKLGEMPSEDVKAEGGGDMSVEQFRIENFKGLSDETWLYVVRFTFIPLHQVAL